MTRILVVDDNEQNRYFLEVLLGGYGFDVDSTSDGIQALEHARQNPPVLVISDILMPNLDGFALCRQWVQDPSLKNIPFVFYTATYTDEKDKQFALELGAARFIVKPAEPEEFMELIHNVLQNHQEGRLTTSGAQVVEEEITYYKGYNQALVRKLEDKMVQLETVNHRLLGLQEANLAMTSTLGLDDVLSRIAGGAVEALNSSTVWLLTVNKEENLLESKVIVGASKEKISAVELALGQSIHEVKIRITRGQHRLVDMILDGEPLMLPNLRDVSLNHPKRDFNELGPFDVLRHFDKIAEFEGLILMPLRAKSETLGVMVLARSQAGEIAPEEMKLFTAFAQQAAIAIENANLYAVQQQYACKLEDEVEARTAELSVALEKAKVADQLKSRLISDINHELRTPLTNIRLYLSLLTDGRREKRREYLDTITRETDRLQQLIENMLDLSMLDSGEIASNLTPTNLNTLLESLIIDRGRLAAEKELYLELTSIKDLPHVMADSQLLYQVLTNLIVNAISYTPAGGKISIAVEKEGETWVVLKVSDTGPGISEEEQDLIFERFYRGKMARENNIAGTGLGLAICKEIMDRHGGRIEVESEIGVGSTFSVWLQAASS